MSPEAQRIVAAQFAVLAALHHLAVAVVVVLFWIRRRSMERTVAVYVATAFLTAAVAQATRVPTLPGAAAAAALSALWWLEVFRPRNELSFRRTPRVRLVLMALAAAFAFIYPGYSGELPTFVFSPLGVTLAPTLLLALALMNCAAPATNRKLHWSLAGVGVVFGVVGLFTEGLIHVPLVAASLYAAPLLLGRAVLKEDKSEVDATSVRAVHERMHKRRVLLSRPRRSSVRRLDVRKRGR
jgi:hypothetical protein